MAEPYVIALAGGSASGKSTLVEALRDRLGETLTVVSMDRYMRKDDPSGPSFFFSLTQSVTFDFNRPDSTDNAAIRRAIEAATSPVVIVEGLMALAAPEIRDRADLRIFLELDADVRAIRRMERDIRTGRGGGNPTTIAAYYVESARVGHRLFVEPSREYAHLILRGDRPVAELASLIQTLISVRFRPAEI